MEKVLWPKGKKCAVMFSFDVDGDTTWENGNMGLVNGDKYMKSLSVGRYGPKRGVDIILDKLDAYGIKGTFFVPGLSAERYPATILRIADAGHEIGHHGYAHERFAGQTVDQQIEIIEKTQEIFQKLIGKKVVGFRTPSGDWSVETPKLLVERGFGYSSSMRGDDKPYRTIIDGKKTDFIEIPTKWELDDYVAMAYNMYPAEPGGQDRISDYGDVRDNFLRELEGCRKYGLSTSFMMHPQVIGTPGRVRILDSLIKYTIENNDIWITTGEEMSDWYRKNNPIDSEEKEAQ